MKNFTYSDCQFIVESLSISPTPQASAFAAHALQQPEGPLLLQLHLVLFDYFLKTHFAVLDNRFFTLFISTSFLPLPFSSASSFSSSTVSSNNSRTIWNNVLRPSFHNTSDCTVSTHHFSTTPADTTGSTITQLSRTGKPFSQSRRSLTKIEEIYS